MFKRASMLFILTLSAAFVPAVWAAAPSQANLSSGGLVSLDFQDADIRNVLKVLAFKSGVNIVAAPDVTGMVNIELKDVPWQRALGVILSTYGYGFVRKDNIITVMTMENLKKYRENALSMENQEPLASRTYALKYARAEDVTKIIAKLINKRGFINFDVRTNSIIIRDVESNLELISGVIKSIDTATPQGKIENKIIEAGGLVSLDFQDADIRNVLKVLAFKSGVNIVAAPEVTGMVNIALKDVPWQKALDVIVSTYGYGFVRKDNVITVMSVENLKKYRENALSLQAQEPLVSRTYALNYARAEDAMKVIDKLVSKQGFINFDVRTNSIIIRDVESNLELISGVIKSIDTVTPQVMIETTIVETDLTNTENLGVNWVMQASLNGASRPTTFPFTQTKNGIWGQAGNNSFTPNNVTGFALSPAPTTDFTYGTINATQLSATLQILSQRSTTKILSNPHIVTLDNQKARINIGLQYPEAIYSFNASTGQLQVTGFTQLPIGVNFEVTPHVNNAGLITLDLHPQISALKATIAVNNNQLPETTNQEAQTKVMVEDGKTLVIGGLITDQTNVTKTKIPVLGDIPWLGNLLFKNTNTVKTKSEVLIFMTPHIITVKDSASTAVIQ